MSHRPKVTNLLLALVVLGATVVVAGCGTTSADPERGRALFRTNCGNCHALAQAGSTATQGPSLDDAFASAREAGMTDATVEGVVRAQVEHPRPISGNPATDMPADIVEGRDLDDVAAYVAMWAGVPGAEPPKVPGGPGAQVFANNGCGGCHILEAAGSGGTTGPDLDETIGPGTTLADIEREIVEPDQVITPGYSAGIMPSIYGQTLSEKELEDLVQYLYENTPAGRGNSGG